MAKKEKKLPELTLEELQVKYDEKAKELFNLKNEYRLNRQLKKPHLLNQTKKEIARILTYSAQKKLETAKGQTA